MSAYRVLQLIDPENDPHNWREQLGVDGLIDLEKDYVDREALDALGAKYGPGKFILIATEKVYGESRLIELEIATESTFKEVTES